MEISCYACHSPEAAPARAQAGFTIVEVAMAAFVLLFAIASSIITLQRGFDMLDTARNSTLATQVLQSEFERLRLMSWDDVQALPARDTVDIANTFSADPKITNRFTVVRTSSDVPDRGGEMKEFTLTVSWTGTNAMPHQRSFKTRYCKNGLYDYFYTLARP